MTYIGWEDLEAIAPEDASPESTVKWIAKAERRLATLIRHRGGNLATLAEDDDALGEIKNVLEDAVLRVLRNPEGLRQESEGDYSRTPNPLDASGNVWFPDKDLDLIFSGSAQARVGSIGLVLPGHRYDAWAGRW